jgi:ABC-type nickel/cobalt efflux system permease component RcnA
MRGKVSLCAAVVLGALLATVPVAAHPLGNFSVNRYAAIGVEPEAVEIRYLVDMAEIPTFQEMQEFGLGAQADHPGTTAYLVRQAEALGQGLRVHVDGRALALRVQARQVSFAPGAADLPTMKLAIVYRAAIEPAASHRLSYRDENFADRLGWREVVARAAPGVVLAASSVPERDRSHQLSDYPADLLDNPPQVAEADIVVERAPTAAVAPVDGGPRLSGPSGEPPRATGAGVSLRADSIPAAPAVRQARADEAPAQLGTLRPAPAADPPVSAPPPTGDTAPAPVVAPESRRGGGSDRALTDLMTRQDMGTGLLLFTLATAMVLGAFHALEPGHGKTVVAAYLVGSRGTTWHAVLLGLAVTISHTAGVFLLGAVTLYASRYVMPERLYPWLGAISGLAIAGVGLALLRQRWRGEPHGHDHGHTHPHARREEPRDHRHEHTHDGDHGHHHSHGPHGDADHHHAHDHPHASHHRGRHHHPHVPDGPVSVRRLFALGLSGGIVPCPGALVVLLGALAWRRLGLGILMVLAFSVGLAAVLVAIGVLMVHARRLLGRVRGDGPLMTRWLPLASSAVITVLGVLIAVQALAGAGRPGG